MRSPKQPALSEMEALFQIAQAPDFGYVVARTRRTVSARHFEARWISCLHHFSCYMAYHFAPTGLGLRTAAQAGQLSRDALVELVQVALREGTFLIVGVVPYDGRYACECFPCATKRHGPKDKMMNGPVRYRNGPHGNVLAP